MGFSWKIVYKFLLLLLLDLIASTCLIVVNYFSFGMCVCQQHLKSIYKFLRDTTLKSNSGSAILSQFQQRRKNHHKWNAWAIAILVGNSIGNVFQFKNPLDLLICWIFMNNMLLLCCAVLCWYFVFMFFILDFVYTSVSDICGIWSHSIRKSRCQLEWNWWANGLGLVFDVVSFSPQILAFFKEFENMIKYRDHPMKSNLIEISTPMASVDSHKFVSIFNDNLSK